MRGRGSGCGRPGWGRGRGRRGWWMRRGIRDYGGRRGTDGQTGRSQRGWGGRWMDVRGGGVFGGGEGNGWARCLAEMETGPFLRCDG